MFIPMNINKYTQLYLIIYKIQLINNILIGYSSSELNFLRNSVLKLSKLPNFMAFLANFIKLT
jgi:hypothetical protein